jgi:hypothetical protein
MALPYHQVRREAKGTKHDEITVRTRHGESK